MEVLAGSGFGGDGIVVAIKDKSDCLHVYAHLDSVAVKVGQKVSKGQIVGRQGTTGQSTGSHLHYEIRKTSSPQYGWIADRANNCFEPIEYLDDYFDKEKSDVLPNVQGLATVQIDNEKEEAYLINNMTYVPIRFVSESLGHKISWDNKNKIARIEG